MRGRLRGGVLHFNKMISSPLYSSGRRVFIHKVHPFNRIHTQGALSYLPTEEVEPMRQYSGEITAGRKGSSFHNQNPIHALQCYILRNRKMMSWFHRSMGPKNSTQLIFSGELKTQCQKSMHASINHCQMSRITCLTLSYDTWNILGGGNPLMSYLLRERWEEWLYLLVQGVNIT